MWSDFLVSNKLEDFTLQTIWWKNNFMFFHNLSFIFFFTDYDYNIIEMPSTSSWLSLRLSLNSDASMSPVTIATWDSAVVVHCNVIFWHTWTDKFYGLLRFYKGMWWFFWIWKCKINVYCHFNITWSYL